MEKLFLPIKKLIATLSGKEIHTEEVRTALSETSIQLIQAAKKPITELFDQLETSSDGITSDEADRRLARYGRNEIAHEKPPPWYRHLLMSFFDPFIGVLFLIAIASFITEFIFAPLQERDLTSVIIISVLILISALLVFIQEFQANQTAEKLLTLVQNTSIVFRRDTGKKELITAEIVRGDILQLSAGDIIPADVRLFDINNLSVNEAPLTGESLPIEKFDQAEESVVTISQDRDLTGINPLDLDNIGYKGTNVVSGSAKALVIATGDQTYLGSMSVELVGHHPPTSFDKGVNKVSLLLIRLMFVMVPIIFLINGIIRGEWLQALLFSLAVAVGLTPEMLPTIVTANLAKGTLEMAREKTVVKRLSAIQNLGAMDVLCTDKTGTLTYDTVALEAYLNTRGETDPFVLETTYLNSYFQKGLRNPIDDAVVAHPDAHNSNRADEQFTKIDEIPFETARRRMSVIVQENQKESRLICKGAVDEMIAISDSILVAGDVQPMHAEMESEIREVALNLNADGLRVLLVGQKKVDPHQKAFTVEDESELVLIGFVGFLDPPKETAGEAIRAMNDKGIEVVVITGDNEIATMRVCQEIGFKITGLVEGSEIDPLSDETLMALAKQTNVFVRTAPLQKSRIVNMIKRNGHTVGFLGDGINDAPSLRDADVGISVDNAVDIAKESADILLLEKSLMVLEEGVARGRLVFGNIMKYIKMTVSSNFGNVFSVLVASIFLPFPPMLPLQLLVQNLLYDVSQLSIPWDHMDEEFLVRPQKWNPASIARFTVYIGPVSSIFDFTTFALLWFIFGANTVAEQSLFHSGWFVLGLLSQTLIVHLIRTQKIPFLQSTASRPVIIMTSLVMIIGLIIPFTGFGINIGFEPLPWRYFPWLILTLVSYCVVIQLVKVWYVKKFGTWL